MKLNAGLLLASAIAAANAATTVICATAYGTSSVSKVGTTSVTTHKTSTKTIIHTTHPTSTVTDPGTTDTITNTVTTDTTTTLATSTDTISTTVFNTTTTTLEATPVTDTVTDTETATTTSTIGPFFTGVQDTLPGADPYSGSSKKRDAAELPEPRRNMLLARAKPKPSIYPTTVTCSKIYKTSTKTTVTRTGTTVTVHTTASPVTTTTDTTITNTVTSAPTANYTDTITSTITDTTTSTSTSTTTTSITNTVTNTVQASPTVACDSTNYASSVNGANIINATPETNDEDFYGVSATDVGSCCAACAANPSCGAFTFLTSNSQCMNAMVGSGDTCSVNGDQFEALLSTGSPGRTTPLVVGNGLCGEFTASET